jgi:hypothetical protein
VNGTSRLHVPALLEIPVTAVVYALCAAGVGVSLYPSTLLILWAARSLLLPSLLSGSLPGAASVAVFCLLLGASFFLFLLCALLAMGICVRVFSLAVRPGTHSALSPTTLFWMMLNSIHTLAFRMVLPVIPGGLLANLYFRLAGCRIGRDVRLTTSQILDPYLISIGDGTMVGGDAVITAHLFQNGQLILARILIGKDCQIGAHALVCPGVTIGDRATVGIKAFVRRGMSVPADAHVEAVSALPAREVVALQNGKKRKTDRSSVAY